MLNAVLALNELDTEVFDSPSPGAEPRIYDSHVVVPDAHLLFNGQFQRVGSNDLKIVGEDGDSFFIRDYFASDTRAHLMSPEGATLSASVVAALAGPLAPGQHAQAGGQAASTQPVIGRVDALSGSATVVRNGVTVVLNVGDTVRKGDVVQTSGSSSVAIVFADGTTFSLNANGRMVLDEFVYAAGGTGNSAVLNLVQGTFSFVAGQVAKTGDMRVETPVATMGIRGTAVLVEISANDGQTRFSVMVEPDGTTGSFNLYNKTTGALIGTVSNSSVGWVVSPAGPLQVVAQQVQKTPGELAQELGIVQQIFTIFDNNKQNPFIPTQDRGDTPNNANPQTAQGGGGSSTPPASTTGTNNPFVDQIETASNNPSTAPSSAVVPLPNGTLPPVIPGAPPPVVTVTVTPNLPPVAINDPDGTPGGGDVTDNDSDPEGSVIVVSSGQHVDPLNGTPVGPVVAVDTDGEPIEGTYGTLTLKADGTYSFVAHGEAFDALSESDTVVETFQYTIADPFGGTATATLTITLAGKNDAPVVTGAVTGTATEDGAAVTLDALGNASDVDTGTTLSVVNVPENLPAGVTYDSETGKFTLDPSNAAYQSLADGEQIVVEVSYNVSDGSVTTPASVSWTVTGTNDAPVAHDISLTNILGNGGFDEGFNGWTVDLVPDGLATVGHSTAVIDNSGSIFEGDGAVAVLSFSGQVPNQPYPYTVPASAEGPSITSDAFTGSAGDVIRFIYQLSSGSSSGSSDVGTVTGKIIDVSTGQVVQTIYNEADLGSSTGPQTVNVELEHSGDFRIEFVLGSVDETLGYVVGARLDLGFAGILRTGVTEDEPFTFDASAFIASASDAEGDAIELDQVFTSAAGATVFINLDGSVTYDPTTSAIIQALSAGETFEDTFEFTVRDEHGAVSNTATASVTVHGLNDAPVIGAVNASGSVSAGAPINSVAAGYLVADHDLINDLGGTAGFGEYQLNRNDDGSEGAINITDVFGEQGLNFFGTYYDAIYINNNGNITFGGPLSSFTPSQIAGNNLKIIAPFWADVDTRGVAASATPGGTSSGSNLVYYDLDAEHGVVTITWDDVGYFSSHTDKLNAFQLQLIDRGDGNFDIVFRYEDVTWTVGDASGGNGGVDAPNDAIYNPARAGYTAGDGDPKHYFELASSGNEAAMLALESTSGNTGIAGVHVFEVRAGEVSNPTSTGTIAFSDADLGDEHTVAATLNAEASSGTTALGAFNVALTHDPESSNGLVTWNYVANTEAVNNLAPGTAWTEVYNVVISDGNGGTVTQQVTITVNGPTDAAPVFHIEEAATYENWGYGESPDSTTLYGLTVTDDDATEGDIFHLTVTADHGTLSPANPLLDNEGPEVPADPQSLTFHATLADINNALSQGVIYTDPEYNGENSSLVDTVTLTVTDADNNSDSMNFIFSVFGETGATLVGTAAKDVMFSTGHNDTFTGSGGNDTFVFENDGEYGSGQDIITDFTQGQDRIALYGIFDDYDEMLASGAFEGNMIDLGCGNSITLQNFNVPLTTLTANDFIFHPSNMLA